LVRFAVCSVRGRSGGTANAVPLEELSGVIPGGVDLVKCPVYDRATGAFFNYLPSGRDLDF